MDKESGQLDGNSRISNIYQNDKNL
jgi:hypothetical protein